jgi:protein required for attachment to host cells
MHHKLAHGAWVFVGDGQKALFLINEGDEKFPNLRRLVVEEHKDPHHANSSDAPGRSLLRQYRKTSTTITVVSLFISGTTLVWGPEICYMLRSNRPVPPA